MFNFNQFLAWVKQTCWTTCLQRRIKIEQNMFGLFKKKSEKEKMQDQYRALLEEAYKLSKVDRKASDAKVEEAEALLQKIESL